jgi:hypothetical protein
VRDLRFWIGFIDTLYTSLGTTGNYGAINGLTLYRSLLHTLSVFSLLHSALLVSWQRVGNSLTVTAAHSEVFFAQHNSFLVNILPTANPGDTLSSDSSAPKPISWQPGVSKLY